MTVVSIWLFEVTSTSFQGSAVTLDPPQIFADLSEDYNIDFITLVLTGSILPSREVLFLLVQSAVAWNTFLWGDKSVLQDKI